MATKILKDEVIRVRIEKEFKNKLKKMCEDKKMNMSELINYMLENEIRKYEFKIRNRKNIAERIFETEEKILKLKPKFKS